MFNDVNGYYILALSRQGDFLLSFTTDPLPLGTDAFATISLSTLSTGGSIGPGGGIPDGSAFAFIDSWTYYLDDGTQSDPQYNDPSFPFSENSIRVANCATITFSLEAYYAMASAQISVFTSSR